MKTKNNRKKNSLLQRIVKRYMFLTCTLGLLSWNPILGQNPRPAMDGIGSKSAYSINSNNDGSSEENEYIYFRSGERDNYLWYKNAQFIVANDWVGTRKRLVFLTENNSLSGFGEYIKNTKNTDLNEYGLSFFTGSRERMNISTSTGIANFKEIIEAEKGIDIKGGGHNNDPVINMRKNSDHRAWSRINSYGPLALGANNVLALASTGSAHLFINTNGKVGIGTNVPLSKLHVVGDLRVQSRSLANTWDNFIIHTDSFRTTLSSNGDEEGMFLSSAGGNKITIGDGNDELVLNGNKISLNYGSTSDLTRVSINTDRNVAHAALTIAGAIYVGPKAELAAAQNLSKFKPEYLDKYNLWVEDGIVTEDIAIVAVDEWRDVVFSDGYTLKSLEDLEAYIKANKHLPGIKSEAEVKKEGYSIVKMDISLLEKIEELTLYTIEQEKSIKLLTKKLEKLEKLITNNN